MGAMLIDVGLPSPVAPVLGLGARNTIVDEFVHPCSQVEAFEEFR
jgi:hypothetical protein